MGPRLRDSLFILPNLFTVSCIFCGCAAVLLLAGTPSADACYRGSLLIVFAMLFDIIDGRVARMTRTQSAFGVQFDSLADVLSFGLAPAAVMYSWSLHAWGHLGTVIAVAFVVCGAIRLARFNVLSQRAEPGVEPGPPRFTVGLPIPVAAGVAVTAVITDHVLSGGLAERADVVAAMMLGLSLLMVSRVRFRSFKDLRPNLRTALEVTLVASVGVVAGWVIHPVFTLAWALGYYLLTGVFETAVQCFRRLCLRPLSARSGRPESEDEDGSVL